MMTKFKRGLNLRGALLKASWQVSTANLARQLAMLASLVLFTTASLVALKGTFRGLDTKLIGGYNYSELVFIFFMFELGYYLSELLFIRMSNGLPALINTGDLDLYLIRPAKLKTQLRYQAMNLPVSITSFTMLSLVIFQQIDFSQVSINIFNIPAAILITLMGVMVYETIFFVLASSAFWFGEAKRILQIGFSLNRANNPPMSGSPRWFLVLHLVLLPISFGAILSAQILLKQFGATEKIYFMAAVTLTIISYLFQKYWWRVCLKRYSSASS